MPPQRFTEPSRSWAHHREARIKPQKLTWEKVDQIRAQYEPGVTGYGSLAKRFGVSAEMIKAIIQGRAWAPKKDFRKRSQAH